MDANTKDVILAIIALISTIVTPLVLLYVTKNQNKKIADNHVDTKKDIEHVVEKVEVYHKEVNGNMSKLLETTKDLATATEKAKNIAEDKSKK